LVDFPQADGHQIIGTFMRFQFWCFGNRARGTSSLDKGNTSITFGGWPGDPFNLKETG
jgi:hypothetical protein